MVTKNDIESLSIVKKVVREYPNTGQKKVFLCDLKNNTCCIIKAVNQEDERIIREIEIVTTNNIPNCAMSTLFEVFL